jgi:4,5-dihydroxyphthalate decarboxylase
MAVTQSTTVVVRDELLSTYSDLAPDIFYAFARSKDLYVRRLRNGEIEIPSQIDAVHRRVMEITGDDSLPYGIAPNRQMLVEVLS